MLKNLCPFNLIHPYISFKAMKFPDSTPFLSEGLTDFYRQLHKNYTTTYFTCLRNTIIQI